MLKTRFTQAVVSIQLKYIQHISNVYNLKFIQLQGLPLAMGSIVTINVRIHCMNRSNAGQQVHSHLVSVNGNRLRSYLMGWHSCHSATKIRNGPQQKSDQDDMGVYKTALQSLVRLKVLQQIYCFRRPN
jgi:hypothetical protein